jgi:hypothetical protein
MTRTDLRGARAFAAGPALLLLLLLLAAPRHAWAQG